MEWRANNKILKDITGQEPRFSRPPGGDYNRAVIQAAQDEGLITVLWTDNSGDYDNPDIKSLEQKIMIRAYNGGIILMHDGEEQTIQLLPKLIEDLKARGFAFETIDDMARERKLI